MWAKYNSFLRNYSTSQAPFSEICEVVVGIDNKNLFFKFTRIFIRLLVRLLGYKVSTKVLGSLLFLFKKNTNTRWLRYFFYLLEVNKIRLEYFDLLCDNQLALAVLKKNKWAEFSLKESMNYGSRLSAKRYLSLLSRHGFSARKYDQCEYVPQGSTDKKFYIFGPNANINPSNKYKDHILVLTKDIDFDTSCFKQKILFSNSVYYTNIISDNEDMKIKLSKKFQSVYVSCRQAKISLPFVRSKFPIGDQLASPMALGRVLYNLVDKYGRFSCVIEGFDFYLDKRMYGDYYPSVGKEFSGEMSDKVVCKSLAEHDALYNFLFVKELVGHLDILGSEDFSKIINLSGVDYLKSLSKVRDFGSCR